MALKKFCNKQGCKNLINITERYCPEHSETEADRQKQYDDAVRRGRDALYTTFYHSPLWEAKRLYIMAKYNSLDVYAYYVLHKTVRATMVHHIRELKDNYDLRLTDSNLIPLSDASHREMDALYKRDKQGTQIMLKMLLERWKREF